MKKVRGSTKQKSGSRLKQLWKDNVKSQHKEHKPRQNDYNRKEDQEMKVKK